MPGFNDPAFIKRWHQLSILERLGNIGSEIERVTQWRERGNSDHAERALYRSLELLDLMLDDPRWKGPRRKEIARVREIVCDFFVGDNAYGTTSEYLKKYFYDFALTARQRREKSMSASMDKHPPDAQ